MFIFTLAKRGPVSGVSVLAEAAGVGSVLGLARGQLVTRTANLGEPEWIDLTGQPCCGGMRKHTKRSEIFLFLSK